MEFSEASRSALNMLKFSSEKSNFHQQLYIYFIALFLMLDCFISCTD